MQWNYFGSGHGKGEHDGAGAVIKRALTSEQLDNKGAKLQNAHDVVEWLTWKMSDDGKNRLFIEVGANEVDRSKSYGCKTVKGTRKTHCVLGFSRRDTTQLLFRSLSCFCSMCLDEAWDECTNLSIVEPWKLQKLEIEQCVDIQEDEHADNIVYYNQCEDLAILLEVGDHFAVLKSPLNEDFEDYYIVVCKQGNTILEEVVRDGWGNMFNVGECVVYGNYYAKLPQCKNTYALLKDAPTAIIYADAVIAIKFSMTQAKHKVKGYNTVYKVPKDVHEHILGEVSLFNA